jgi:integrase
MANEVGLLDTMPTIRNLPERNGHQGFFTADEVERTVTHVPMHLKVVGRFAYFAGWRKGEIVGLQWSEIDRQDGVIRLSPTRSKNGEGRVLVYTDEVRDIIEQRWAHRKGEYVFHWDGVPIGNFRKA